MASFAQPDETNSNNGRQSHTTFSILGVTQWSRSKPVTMKAVLFANIALLFFVAGIADTEDEGSESIAAEQDQSKHEAQKHKHLEICILL